MIDQEDTLGPSKGNSSEPEARSSSFDVRN